MTEKAHDVLQAAVEVAKITGVVELPWPFDGAAFDMAGAHPHQVLNRLAFQGYDTRAVCRIEAWTKERPRPPGVEMLNLIGKLDRVISEVMVLAGKREQLDEPDRQTLKHHADDMRLAGEKVLEMLRSGK